MLDDTIRWLLEDTNPAIRYRTLTDICDEKDSTEQGELYESIWNDKNVVKMLNKQGEDGLFESEKKYYGSFTALRYLTAFAEYGLHKDERIDRLANQTIEELKVKVREDPGACETTLVLRALVMLGYQDSEDVMELIQQCVAAQLVDGGFMCKRLLEKRPDRKSCYKAALTGLLLYGECKKKNIILKGTEELIHYFTKRDVFYTSDKSKMFADGKPGWRFIDNFFPVEPMRIGLPMIVASLAILGVGQDPAMKTAWELLEQKKDECGRLQLEGTLSKQPCNFGKLGENNPWVTYYAVLAEKYR